MLVGCALALRMFATVSGAESVDGLLFIRGVLRYSVRELRPQWPGYPLYILAGKLVGFLLGSAETGLRLISQVSSSVTAALVARLSYSIHRSLQYSQSASLTGGACAGLVWAFMPLPWLAGCEINSDSLGLLLGLAVLVVAWEFVMQRASRRGLVIAGVLAGLMLGVRLAYVTLLLPLPLAAVIRAERAQSPEAPRTRGLAGLTCLLVVVAWFALQMVLDGRGFLAAGQARLLDHMNHWGRRVLSSGNWLERPVAFLRTYVVYGVGGWWLGEPAGLARLLVTTGLLLSGLAGLGRLAGRQARLAAIMLGAWAVPYALGVLAFHDPALARYSLPLVVITCVVMSLGLPEAMLGRLAATAALCVSIALVAGPLAAEHRVTPALGVQLSREVSTRLRGSSVMLVTEDVAYLQLFLSRYAPGVRTDRIAIADLPDRAAAEVAAGSTVYAMRTDPARPNDWLPLARFHRDRRLESRGPTTAWLYQYAPRISRAGVVANRQLEREIGARP
jgi:4-amino-4-deoxy-L-arabinose transferase-like glycosyltransferase